MNKFTDLVDENRIKADDLRPGQRLIVYANQKVGAKERDRPDDFEIWLWNISEKEFRQALEWRVE